MHTIWTMHQVQPQHFPYFQLAVQVQNSTTAPSCIKLRLACRKLLKFLLFKWSTCAWIAQIAQSLLSLMNSLATIILITTTLYPSN
jgi:hypothetical protein